MLFLFGLVGTAFFTAIEIVIGGQDRLKAELSCFFHKKQIWIYKIIQ